MPINGKLPAFWMTRLGGQISTILTMTRLADTAEPKFRAYGMQQAKPFTKEEGREIPSLSVRDTPYDFTLVTPGSLPGPRGPAAHCRFDFGPTAAYQPIILH